MPHGRGVRDILLALFDAAVRAAQPAVVVPPHLPRTRPAGRTIVLGAGKASAAMAREVEDHLDWPVEGLVVTRYGHAVPCRRIRIAEAGHPVPDAAGEAAARDILALARSAVADDLVICLISGGGSALMPLPAPGLTLADKQDMSVRLLRSGATISEMNAVRRALSAIKGGGLARAAAPARVLSLIISDVPGDRIEDIASGPTAPDVSPRHAAAILARYGIDVPERVRAVLARQDELAGAWPAGVENVLVATPQLSLEAAAGVALARGYTPLILSDAMEGEARVVGGVHAAIAVQAARHGQPAAPPCAILSGGETTVTLRGEGKGGRNAEFLLALALALNGQARIGAIACDTDGIDGTEDNAGALIMPDSLARAAAMGLDARAYLARNDAYTFFARLSDLVVTGPTLTNVNDFRAVLIGG